MKDRIINIVVVIAMIVFANYPMYKNLKSTAKEIDLILQTVQVEIIAWQKDINIVQGKIEGIRNELVGTVNKGLAQTDSVLNKIKLLESETKALGNKIDSLKSQVVDKFKTKVEVLNKVKLKTDDKIKKTIKLKDEIKDKLRILDGKFK